MEDLDTTKYAKGFRFNPFDDELIDDYLKPRITNEPLPCKLIKDKDVYGEGSNPWRVFDSTDWFRFPGLKSTEKCVYVFARLSKLSKSNRDDWKNTSKTAGCGTWAGKGKPDKILDSEGKLIGVKRYLVFKINDVDSVEADGMDPSKVGQYRMHEFSLSGHNAGLNSDAAASVVLCRITHDSSKNCTINCKSGTGTKVPTSEAVYEKEESTREAVHETVHENYNNAEGTSNVTTENLTVLDSDVGECSAPAQLDDFCYDNGAACKVPTSEAVYEKEESTGEAVHENYNNVEGTENLTVLESDVGECSAPAQLDVDYWKDLPLDEVGNENLCFGDLGRLAISLDDLGCLDLCFDNQGGEDMCSGDLGYWGIDRISECLDTNQQEETLQGTSSKLGKRMLELEENSYQAKKTCLNPY